jgi:hypothetical protein
MSATEWIHVGEPMPTVREVRAIGPSSIEVAWGRGKRRGERSIVDLAPLIFSRKLFAPLRGNGELFGTVHVIEDGIAVAWGDKDQIDLAATAVETLADEAMVSADFAAFLRRHSLSFDAAAAQLGISRRLIAYYAKERQIPRYIALACAYLDGSLPRPSVSNVVESASFRSTSGAAAYSLSVVGVAVGGVVSPATLTSSSFTSTSVSNCVLRLQAERGNEGLSLRTDFKTISTETHSVLGNKVQREIYALGPLALLATVPTRQVVQ